MAAGFIFDIDGTIIDSMPFHERSWDVFLARRGVPAVREDFFRRTAGRAGMRAVAIASTLPAEELGAPAHVVARACDFTTLDPHALALHRIH